MHDALEELNLSYNNLDDDDEGLGAIASGLRANTTMKTLILTSTLTVTPSAWATFFARSLHPDSSLKTLIQGMPGIESVAKGR